MRDTFELPGHPELLLVVASDRVSIFDYVLNAQVWAKGIILNLLSCYWMRSGGVLAGIPNHLVAMGRDIDQFLKPEPLRGIPDLRARGVVVRKLNIVLIECVVRGYLTGSGWRDYKQTGEICGIKLPPGLQEGCKLPTGYFPLFTPTSKATSGHDKPLNARVVMRQYPELARLSIRCYKAIHDAAAKRGFIFADTKFEFGSVDGVDGYVLADEVGTPDSSRFWDFPGWEKSQTANPPKSPPGWDKEPVRKWGTTVETPFGVTGINNLDPITQEYLTFVDELEVPVEVVNSCSRRYQDAFRRLQSRDFSTFLDSRHNIRLPARTVAM